MDNSLLNEKLNLIFKGKLESETLNNYLNNTQIVANNLIEALKDSYKGNILELSEASEEIDIINFYKSSIPRFSINQTLNCCYNTIVPTNNSSGNYVTLKVMDSAHDYEMKEAIRYLFYSSFGLKLDNNGVISHDAEPSGSGSWKGNVRDGNISGWNKELTFISFKGSYPYAPANSTGHIQKELGISKIKMPDPSGYTPILEKTLAKYVDQSFNPDKAIILDVIQYDYIVLVLRTTISYSDRYYVYTLKIPNDYYDQYHNSEQNFYFTHFDWTQSHFDSEILTKYDAGNLIIENWSSNDGFYVKVYGIK